MVDRRETWTLDKKVGLGVIVSLILAICSGVGSIVMIYVNYGARISSVESAISYQRGVNDQVKDDQRTLKADTNQAISKVEATIARMDAKIDRLLERR